MLPSLMMSASPNDLGKHHLAAADTSLKNPTFYDIILPEERWFFCHYKAQRSIKRESFLTEKRRKNTELNLTNLVIVRIVEIFISILKIIRSLPAF